MNHQLDDSATLAEMIAGMALVLLFWVVVILVTLSLCS